MAEALLRCGNASSVHRAGRAARQAVEAARDEVAALVGAASADVIFTSGGSEANQTALRGFPDRRVILSAIEHDSVRAAARTESCSIAERITRRSGNPRSAVWLASLPPLVKITSAEAAPTSAATSSRAASTAWRAARPARWTDEALPHRNSASAIAAATSGSTGAVAFQSR